MSAVPALAAAMAALLAHCWPTDGPGEPRERDERALWLVTAVLALLVA